MGNKTDSADVSVADPPLLEVRAATRDRAAVEGRWFLLPVGASDTIVPTATIDHSRDGHEGTRLGARATADRLALAWNGHDALLEALKKIADMPPRLTVEQLVDQFVEMRVVARNAITAATDSAAAATHQWRIWISGYGDFDFAGTEAAAEEMRIHKAHWERGRGLKWRSDLGREVDRLTADLARRWANGEGVPQSLLSAIKRAKAPPTDGAEPDTAKAVTK